MPPPSPRSRRRRSRRSHVALSQILLEASEARESIFFVEHRAALGMPYPQDSPHALHIVTQLALTGAQDEAECVYDKHLDSAAGKPSILEHDVAALVALGRLDAAAARVATEPPDRQWLLRKA